MKKLPSSARAGMRAAPRREAAVDFIAGAASRVYPAEVADAAKKALVDFVGVAAGASDEPLSRALRRAVMSWQSEGRAPVVFGETMAPALAALINGTMVHAAEYDDQNPNGSGHPSAPCWAASLALGAHHGLDEQRVLSGFITGYEIAAKLGGGGPAGVGRTLQKLGFHPTSLFGRVGAAGAACAMLGHERGQIAHALGIAATTAGGLLASFGTDCKPFHAGKAAMDGVLAAQMAAEGFTGPLDVLELEGGLLGAFLRGAPAEVPPLDLGQTWELLRNGFKLYACCRATHSSTQAAIGLAPRVAGKKIARIRAKVHANAIVVASNREPRSPMECKFSAPFCIAMGLRGYRGLMADFSAATLHDPAVESLLPLVELEAVEGQDSQTAHLDVYLENGEHLQADTRIVKGHPDNPLGWDDLRAKFLALVEPAAGTERAKKLFDCLAGFERPGSMKAAAALLSGSRAKES